MTLLEKEFFEDLLDDLCEMRKTLSQHKTGMHFLLNELQQNIYDYYGDKDHLWAFINILFEKIEATDKICERIFQRIPSTLESTAEQIERVRTTLFKGE